MLTKAFYIYYLEGTDTFQLRTVEEHFCYSSSSYLEDIKDSLARIIKRVKTIEGLHKEVKKLHHRPNEDTVYKRQQEYLSGLHRGFDLLLEDTITQALKDIPTSKNILKRSLKKLDTSPIKVDTIVEKVSLVPTKGFKLNINRLK